jgi:hypothetical protein
MLRKFATVVSLGSLAAVAVVLVAERSRSASLTASQGPTFPVSLPIHPIPARHLANREARPPILFPIHPDAAKNLAKMRQAERNEAERYRGFRLNLNPQANGPDVATQRNIGILLTLLDVVPEERMEHFGWLSTHSVVITGWVGSILNMTPVDSGVVLAIAVSAEHSGGPSISSNDTIIEYYHVDGTALSYLGSHDSNEPKFLGFF